MKSFVWKIFTIAMVIIALNSVAFAQTNATPQTTAESFLGKINGHGSVALHYQRFGIIGGILSENAVGVIKLSADYKISDDLILAGFIDQGLELKGFKSHDWTATANRTYLQVSLTKKFEDSAHTLIVEEQRYLNANYGNRAVFYFNSVFDLNKSWKIGSLYGYDRIRVGHSQNDTWFIAPYISLRLTDRITTSLMVAPLFSIGPIPDRDRDFITLNNKLSADVLLTKQLSLGFEAVWLGAGKLNKTAFSSSIALKF